ncbi:MAG: hypothetical protein U9Q84_01975 [Thermodesulfobacteriota bacterium]|nr:hypothetical protein [Thermodesulfobacteriota bacterium]
MVLISKLCAHSARTSPFFFKIFSKIEKRPLTGQIEYWAKNGKCAEENPDLTYSLIKDILIGLAELEQCESSEYKFG